MSGPTLQDIETLLNKTLERCQAIEALTGSMPNEAAIKEIAKSVVTEAINNPDPDFAPKLAAIWSSNGQADPRLKGSKFAKFGLSVGHIEFLYDLQKSLMGKPRVKGGGVYTGPSEDLENAFNHLSGAYFMTEEEARRKNVRDLEDEFQRYHGPIMKWGRSTHRAFESAVKAMDTAESGYGGELDGQQYVGDLWVAARGQSRIFGLLDTFEMTAPTAFLPVEADIPEPLFVSENTANNSSNYGTVKTGSNRVQVDAKKFVIHQMWSGELEEDSIIPFLDFLRMQILKSIAHYSDALVINGDTTNSATGNINLDDADPTDTKYYLAFDGIRHAALVDNTNNDINAAAAITWNLLMNAKGKMIDETNLIDWGHPTDPEDLIYAAHPEMADEVAKLSEVLTVDKYGQNAVVLTGEVARLGRHPFIASIAVPKTEADGKASTTAASNTLGQVVAFNRRGFKVGWRRRVKVETERLPATDQTRIVYSMRLGFGRYTATGNVSGLECAATIRNVTLGTT